MNVVDRTWDQGDQAQLLATIDRWLERDVRPVVKEYDHADRWPADIVTQMQEFGLSNMAGSACRPRSMPRSSCASRQSGWRSPASSTRI
jgi:alkylation response protein AidB-like acyl-CoA dehydrogenase